MVIVGGGVIGCEYACIFAELGVEVSLVHNKEILLPFLDRHERKYRTGARAYFDCTWPLDWEPEDVPERMSFAQAYPMEVQKQALAKWRKYGY